MTQIKFFLSMWATLPSAVIATVGVIFNAISLSYFIKKEHESLGWQYKFVDKRQSISILL